MSVELDTVYDRERLVLFVAGLLPSDYAEAKQVLKLTDQVITVLQNSRERRPDQRDG